MEIELESSTRSKPRMLREGRQVEPDRYVPPRESPTPDREQTKNWLDALREELDGYYAIGKTWSTAEPDLAMAQISAIFARLTEMRALAMRDGGQRSSKFRLSEIDPLMDSLQLQFKLTSRMQAVRQHDFEITRGAPS